ncbi:hypothetical protein [Aeromicrobium sp. CnD17-E]|uniref:hypothetical protein n=1 Tax=Aeromicrobium sp. CnD17-E TaxID=2954487 RepID=UPI002097CF38|nr:hypothetical protein [Aeromicrobium sp. CnD17-E]MCO7238406.1 hypothetical protein [Aeromicrobium sp. CnD17-E]
MSETLLAGLGGGVLALLGGFGVQWLGGRQARRSRRSTIAASFLADVNAFLIVTIKASSRNEWTDVETARSWFDATTSALDPLRRSGHELALLTPRLRQDIIDLMEACEDLLLLAAEAPRADAPRDGTDEFGNLSMEVRGRTDQLAKALAEQP